MGKQIILDYINAIKNESAVDEQVYKVFNESASFFHGIPRPAKWVVKIKKIKKIMKFLSFIFFYLWSYFGAYIFFTKELFVSLIRLAFEREKVNVCKEKAIALAFSNRSVNVIQQALGDKSLQWMLFHWVDNGTVIDDSDKIIFFKIVTFDDLIKAFILSIKAHIKIGSGDIKYLQLQSYTAFRWFCVRLVFDKLNHNDIVTAEHYDRWAVLLDTSQKKKKELGYNNTFILVQHGNLNDINKPSAQNIGFRLPYKLRSVGKVYAYDSLSINIFKNSIIEEGSSSVKYNIFKSKIVLEPKIENGNFSILFIGHPACENLHVDICNHISKDLNLKLYYKPHPTVKCSSTVYNCSWEVIDDINRFPKVDLIVSYPSTLVNEYQSCGVIAITHPMTASLESTYHIVENVKVYIGEVI